MGAPLSSLLTHSALWARRALCCQRAGVGGLPQPTKPTIGRACHFKGKKNSGSQAAGCAAPHAFHTSTFTPAAGDRGGVCGESERVQARWKQGPAGLLPALTWKHGHVGIGLDLLCNVGAIGAPHHHAPALDAHLLVQLHADAASNLRVGGVHRGVVKHISHALQSIVQALLVQVLS